MIDGLTRGLEFPRNELACHLPLPDDPAAMSAISSRLAVYKGTKLDMAFPVTEAATTIGRDDGNPIQLPDPQVSKRHAVIRAKDDVWMIEDLDSTNGIAVNGVKVKHAELKNGDKIRIGPFDLVFESTATGEWVPSLVIDMSSKVAYQTIVQPPRGLSAG